MRTSWTLALPMNEAAWVTSVLGALIQSAWPAVSETGDAKPKHCDMPTDQLSMSQEKSIGPDGMIVEA
jgi:hypothetical protein